MQVSALLFRKSVKLMLFQIKQNSVAKNDEGGLDDSSFQNEEPFDERLFEALGLKVHKV